jgi:hypothetical protein
MSEIAALQAEVATLRELLERSVHCIEDARLLRAGLLGYEGLRQRLAIDGKPPCLRTVKEIVRKHRRIIRPVELGHKLVGFRPPRVDALIAHLAGDEPIGGPQL